MVVVVGQFREDLHGRGNEAGQVQGPDLVHPEVVENGGQPESGRGEENDQGRDEERIPIVIPENPFPK
jgi:hypothetical protein